MSNFTRDETAATDPAVTAVDEAIEALGGIEADTRRAAGRLRAIRSKRLMGRRWTDILASGTAREVLDLLGSVTTRLTEATLRTRQVIARALRADGMRVGRIAEVIGVSHQRISQVLNHGRE